MGGVEDVEDCGTEEDAEEEGEGGFGEVEGVADEGGEEGVGEEEGGEDEVGEVGGNGLEVFFEPGHGDWGFAILGGVLRDKVSLVEMVIERRWYYEIIVTSRCISRLLCMRDVSTQLYTMVRLGGNLYRY